MKKILTGIKPTGDGMHLGNYVGAFQPLQKLSKQGKTYLMLADLHSLTSVHEGATLRKNKKRMLCEYFALLGEDTDIVIFEQSAVQKLTEIFWVLNSVTPYSLMLRAHSFKDAQNKKNDINMAVFNYPVLMAADIIAYDIDMVPVGKDQKQHLEFTRDIAGNFNKKYNTEFFTLPDPSIQEEMMIIPGTDGRKMSKSYNNFIGIFDDEKMVKKKIMSIVTGSEALEDEKDPENCNVFALIKLLGTQEQQDEIAAKYRAGGYGYGHAKLSLLEIFLQYFGPARARYEQLSENFEEVYKGLEKGNQIMSEMAERKYSELKEIVGL